MNYCPDAENQKIKKIEKEVILVNKEVNLIDVVDGYVLPRYTKGKSIPYQGLGGVLNSSRLFIKESAIFDLDEENRITKKLAFGGEYRFKEYITKDESVIYLGLAHQQWGHFLIFLP